MISLNNIAVQFGGKFLFDNITFTVTERDRIGLVGKNGAGKTTLLRLLMSEFSPTTGHISMDNNTNLGYLPQNLALNPTQTVYQETLKAFAQLEHINKELAQAEAQLLQFTESQDFDYTLPAYERLLHRIADLHEQLDQQRGGNPREQIEKILKGLGFKNGDFDRPLNEVSGGWQMRVELAKILLQNNDFLLLDEPTNHLDIEAIIWLEGFLAKYPGGVLLISHDRAFLDAVTNRTIELVSGKAYDYRASYTEFMELREKRIEKQIAEANRQDKFVEHTQTLINKFRAKKNKAKFAQTLIRKLERLERIEIDDLEGDAIDFRFPDAPRSGRIVVELQHLSKNYGAKEVLSNLNLQIERGEKIAFVGRNGEGKTTLAKIIVGREPATNGVCTLGHNVSIGYYEQHQAEALDGNNTVFEVIDNAASGDMRLRVRHLLGAFLFSGEDVDKKVQVLSGGEKSRLALARLLLEPCNLLLLDEPTNHLDMYAKEVLKEALKAYNGTLIVVSHDRDFLRDLTDKVFEFKDQKIKPYIGDVYDFLRDRNVDSLDALNLKTTSANSNKANPENNKNTENINLPKLPTTAKAANSLKRTLSYDEMKQIDSAIRKAANQINQTENRISQIETDIANLEIAMNDPNFYQNQQNASIELVRHTQLKQQLAVEMENWEKLQVEHDALQQQRQQIVSD